MPLPLFRMPVPTASHDSHCLVMPTAQHVARLVEHTNPRESRKAGGVCRWFEIWRNAAKQCQRW